MKNFKKLSRRETLKMGALGAATLFVPFDLFSNTLMNEEPHFFFHILIEGGFDSSYLFDARSLEMTKAGLIQNYLNEEPTTWTGSNGGTALVTSLTQPLKAYQQDFSVLNGVFMAPSFDGHEQNMNFLFTGNPFGGAAFIPDLNQVQEKYKLDGIINRFPFVTVNNTGNVLPLKYSTLKGIVTKLQTAKPIDSQQPLWKFVESRYQAQSMSGEGRFANTSTLLQKNLGTASDLQAQLKALNVPDMSGDEDELFLKTATLLFQKKLSRSAVLLPTFSSQVDTHDATSAKQNPAIAKKIVDVLVKTFEIFKATPFDNQRSLFDVTTILVTSEFSRTMRQTGNAIDNTGTDHNNLTNTVILAGKGIKGGQLIGASDYASKDWDLTKAHLQLDPTKLKTMAQPFDFSKYQPRSDRPATFQYQDYLSFGSVANTIYELFGVPKSKYRIPERDAKPSPVLTPVIKV